MAEAVLKTTPRPEESTQLTVLSSPFADPELKLVFPGDAKFHPQKVFRRNGRVAKGHAVIESVDEKILSYLPQKEVAQGCELALARIRPCKSVLLDNREQRVESYIGAPLSWAAIAFIMAEFQKGKPFPMGDRKDFLAKVSKGEGKTQWVQIFNRCSNWVVRERPPGKHFLDRSVFAIHL